MSCIPWLLKSEGPRVSDATPSQTSSELLLSTCCFGIAVPLSVFFWKDKPYWKGPSKLALLSQGQGHYWKAVYFAPQGSLPFSLES